MTTTSADLAADFQAAYVARYPNRPAPAVTPYGQRKFIIREGWATRTSDRYHIKRETAAMFIAAAMGFKT